MKLPTTLKKTTRTVTVQVSDRQYKVVKSRSSYRLTGCKGMMEHSKTLKTWKWHCEELSLVNLTRLEMEKELLNLAGNNVKYHMESLSEWNLAQEVKQLGKA